MKVCELIYIKSHLVNARRSDGFKGVVEQQLLRVLGERKSTFRQELPLFALLLQPNPSK